MDDFDARGGFAGGACDNELKWLAFQYVSRRTERHWLCSIVCDIDTIHGVEFIHGHRLCLLR